ncbi:MAG TPA: TIGR03619 family F420-dependent LLM class oxidoreductase [Acidimicrobiales bacterium]|nr:TIGR03619 family F420-dependent LLM class oxidoreductase [Acidimicrobiales bacterium]
MNVGVWIPCYRRWTDRAAVLRLAREAEAMGFGSLWVQDHIVAPLGDADEQPVDLLHSWLEPDDYGNQRFSAVEYYGEENWWLDPYVLWGFLAAATETCELASNVIVLPYRNPVVQAKMLGTLDVLSGGRMVLGVGVGHVPGEFDVLDVPYKERGHLTDEYLQVMAALLENEEVSFEGKTIRFPMVRNLVQPVQRPRPPFLVGGTGKKSIRRAVDLGDGWLPAHVLPHQLGPAFDYLAEYAGQQGKPVPPVSVVSVVGITEPGQSPPSGSRRRFRTVAETAALIAGYAELGVVRLAVDVPNPNLDVTLRQYELLAEAMRMVAS